MTVKELRRQLMGTEETAEVLLGISRCERSHRTLTGGEWVVVSGYFDIERVRQDDGSVVLWGDRGCG